MEPIESIGPYQVLRRLGAGGMGEVYLAEDPRLGRQVAIKRPSEAWLRSPEGRERLRREARAVARLSHPNIAAVYDVLDIDDRPHIVMEFVEGRTLGELIAHGPMAPARAIEIGIQLMEALADAHLHGVIHRDLKPRNVIVTPAGRVKVLDFGLAQVEEPVQAAPGSGGGSPGSITETGRVMGTPGYMAPEQLMGHRADERTDLYSAGIVLYELLTGRTVRAETDPMGRALAAVASDPPRVDSVTPAVPPQLAEIIAKCIARDPARRYQHAGEMRSALARAQSAMTDAPTVVNPWSGAQRRWARRRGAILLAAVAVVVIAAAATYQWWWPGAGFPAGPRTVAVLPFFVDPQDTELVAVSVGLREVIVNTLAATEGMRAIPWSPDERTPDPSADVRQIARARRAGFALTGGLGRVAGGIALTVRLTPAGSGGVWEKTYQSASDGVVSSAYQALSDLARELRVPLLAVRPAPSGQAFQEYARARSLLERRDVAGNVDKAIALLEGVTGVERQFALGFAALGEAYWQKYRLTRDATLVTKASNAILTALALDPGQPLVRLALATILDGTGESARAEEELRAVIRKNPTDVAHRALGTILVRRGKDQVEEGLAELQRAIDIRPDVALNYRTKGAALLSTGRYADAEQVLRRAADLQPDHAGVHQQLGTTYQLMGDVDRAIAEFRRSLDLAPSATSWSNLGTLLQDSGKKAEALDAFEHAVKMSDHDPRIRRNLGDVLQQLGRVPDARAEFERCATLSDEALKVNPRAAETHGVLGVCHAKLGRFKEAIAAANQGVLLAPSSSDAYHRLAAVLALADRPAEAVAALEKGFASGLGAGLVRRDDDLASLRARPDYQALVAKAR